MLLGAGLPASILAVPDFVPDFFATEGGGRASKQEVVASLA
jgi:hypothetical protein